MVIEVCVADVCGWLPFSKNSIILVVKLGMIWFEGIETWSDSNRLVNS